VRLLKLLLLTAALAAAQSGPLEIQILYDNTAAQAGLAPDWGFAALVTYGGHRILFDTGAKPDVFMGNVKKLGVDPSSLEQVVISHVHADHTGGLAGLTALNARLVVHGPAGSKPFEVVPGVYSTGLIAGSVFEQALVIETPKGLVILTGCSHPGVVKMVEAAVEQRGNKPVRLLLGGFHMLEQKSDEINAEITSLKGLKVAAAVPTHCSGELAIKLFREAFGPGPGAGVGRRIVLE
jgi:7,8-dihydropterin-6-yl-methyl-4-(beta-D-ribofuranosyl)aminobenzene 5'-phosphate synthase